MWWSASSKELTAAMSLLPQRGMGRPRTGQASFSPRDGYWIARVLLHREPRNPNGRPRYASLTVLFEDKPLDRDTTVAQRYAQTFALHAQERYDAGEWVPPGATAAPPTSSQTVQTWVTSWLESQVNTKSYAGAAKDLARCSHWLPRSPVFAQTTLRDLSPQLVAAWLVDLRASKSATGEVLASRTQRNVADPVRRAIRAAVFQGLVPGGDPFSALPRETRPKARDSDPEARTGYRMSRADVEVLLREPSIENRWKTFWHLLVFTGARVSEAIGLRWSDIIDDKPLRRIVIATQISGSTRKRTPTKTRDAREVPEHPALRACLDAWRTEGWPQEYGRKPEAGDLIVPCRGSAGRPWGTAEGSGGPLWQSVVWRAVQRDLEACGLAPHRTHDFRHTFASLCSDAGMAEAIASRWTHQPSTQAGARSLYVRTSWDRQCTEMLRLDLRTPNG